ncbi:MAG TPA: hypothetical protein ENG92_00190 [Thiolapillus brandeum]|uniref:Uncharacterized protein n=1 Tax=Thiolapillus brandeum TaxID=1076588 RepID=A0A831KBL9_9GAMM|nr:hypothetical protein [Thiolapillus brandeum]
MKPFLMMRKRNAIAGIFLNDNAGMPGLTRAGKTSLEPAGPTVMAAVIYDNARNEVKVTFNGIVGGNVDGGVTFTIDGGAPETFLTSRTSTNYVTYIAEANFLASHVVRWIYTPGTITVDGELLGAQDLLVSNQIASAPEYVSGRIYEQGGEQFAEITFNGPMLYSNYNGVTIKADGGAKAITAISGMGSTKVTYKTAGINNLHTVTWEYVSATGNLTNTGGDPLADVTPQVISNVLPFQTHWDLAGNDPTTYWDGDPPDNTPWDKD